MMIYDKKTDEWVDSHPNELSVGSIYKIDPEDEKFTPGIYMSFGRWADDNYPKVKSNRILIGQEDSAFQLPVYPSMDIVTATIVNMTIYRKGIYLFPNELAYCFSKDGYGIDYDAASRMHFLFNNKDKHHDYGKYLTKLIRMYNKYLDDEL